MGAAKLVRGGEIMRGEHVASERDGQEMYFVWTAERHAFLIQSCVKTYRIAEEYVEIILE